MDNNLKTLHDEVDFYRQNQAILEQEIHKLIEDNQKLSQQIEHLLREKQRDERPLHNNNSDKEIDELKKQIQLITKAGTVYYFITSTVQRPLLGTDLPRRSLRRAILLALEGKALLHCTSTAAHRTERDSLHVLWQTSQKTIDALEVELKTYQSYDNNGKHESNEGIRELQLKFDTVLQDYIELETKYKELNAKFNSLETESIYKDKEINTYKERGKELENKLKQITAELDEFKINLAAEKKNNEEMRTQLLLCQKESADKMKKELEAKSKVRFKEPYLYFLISPWQPYWFSFLYKSKLIF
ncbi:unnamed protein product [Diatraea saccharalis]|uniref:Uncharacterized protein n=1 Tax=Diatraea saccharalis TaxID=40085 RepID=A0A9N9QTF9_9NEOP|nr:unnamed protein product [Diatraea saccharalis]